MQINSILSLRMGRQDLTFQEKRGEIILDLKKKDKTNREVKRIHVKQTLARFARKTVLK